MGILFSRSESDIILKRASKEVCILKDKLIGKVRTRRLLLLCSE
jgi:hypothetical protein